MWTAWAYNLGQVKGIVADGVEDEILQLVDDTQKILSERRHGAEVAGYARLRGCWPGRVRACCWVALVALAPANSWAWIDALGFDAPRCS